jgi:hypothetical protein
VTTPSVDRLALYFSAKPSRQGLLARAALHAESSRDQEITRRLIAALESDIRPDGSVGGGALPTVWRVHELSDLSRGTGGTALGTLMRWVLALQGQPGAFGEGCDKERHARHACEHHLHGFFAPGPPGVRLAPVTFPNGKVFRAEPAARFALSCLALRAALRTTAGNRPSIDRHVRSLAALAAGWTTWKGFFAPDTMVAGLHVLAHAGPTQRGTVAALVALVAVHQDPAGSWPNADLFHTLDALMATGLPEAREAVRRALPALAERQRADGSFGGAAQQERALIGLRAVLWAGGRT